MEALILKRPGLPRELLSRRGLLAKEVDAVASLPRNTFRQACTQKVNEFTRRFCHSFKPSHVDPLLCRSGETSGRPFRGSACAQCQLGQFSSNLVFIGQITSAPAQPQLTR